MDDLLREFLAETAESLAVLDVELVKFERDPNDAATLGNIFRLVHTIKGTCGFLGLSRRQAVAHAGENILGKFRDGELPVTPAAVTLILKCLDRIRQLLGELEATGSEPAGDDSALITELNEAAEGRMTGGDAAAPSAAPAPQAPAEASAVPVDDGGFPVAAELLAEVEQALAKADAPAAVAEAPPAQPAPAKPAAAEAPKPATPAAKIGRAHV